MVLYHSHLPVLADTVSVICAYVFSTLCRVKTLCQDDLQALHMGSIIRVPLYEIKFVDYLTSFYHLKRQLSHRLRWEDYEK
jgi:hypothetical protein